MYLQSLTRNPALCQGFNTCWTSWFHHTHTADLRETGSLRKPFPAHQRDATPSPVRGGRIYPNPMLKVEEGPDGLRGRELLNHRAGGEAQTTPDLHLLFSTAAESEEHSWTLLSPAAGCMSEGKLLYPFRMMFLSSNRSTYEVGCLLME